MIHLSRKAIGDDLKRVLGGEYGVPKSIDIKPGNHYLLNPTRRGIFVYLCNFPCASQASIVKRFQRSYGSIRWHLDVLMEMGVLNKSDVFQGIYYPVGYILPPDIRPIAHLQRGPYRKIFRYVLKNPGANNRQIAEFRDLHKSRITQIKNKLLSLGLLEEIKEGRERHLYVSSFLKERRNVLRENSDIYRALLKDILTKDGVKSEYLGNFKDRIRFQIIDPNQRKIIIDIPRDPYTSVLEEDLSQ